MKQIVVGVFDIGPDQVTLVLREDTGGEFYSKPEKGKIGLIKIGAYYGKDEWEKCVGVLLHESFEFVMRQMNLRFTPAVDFANAHDGYLFVFGHPQFSELCARVGNFVTPALPKLADAFDKWHKKKR